MPEEKQEKVKDTKAQEAQKVEEKKETVYCYLRSKADFDIPVKINKNTTIIPPFGKIKVIKTALDIDPQFARYLSIIKL